MAFKSNAQRQRFLQMLKEGKITKAVYDDFAKETPDNIPERINAQSRPIRRVKVIK